MKILLISTYYYPAFVGGAEISVKLLAEGMVNAGNDVYVLTTGLTDKVYRVNGVNVIAIKQKNLFNSYSNKAPQFIKAFWHLIDSCNTFYHFQISSVIKRIKPDIVHTNSIQGFSPFLWLTIKSQKIPLVHSMRDYYMLCHKCSMFNNGHNCETLCAPCKVTHTIKKDFFRYPDHFIGISKYIINKYKSYLPISGENISLIYNSTEANTIDPDRSLNGKLRFGFIGRVARDKGVAYLVDELAMLSDQEKSTFKIIFAGKGDPEFISEISDKLDGIDHEFLGLTSPKSFYSNIDVLLVPALWNEPFGRIVIESLSYGVPVCQSDKGGLKEIYNPDNSWMYTPEKGNLSVLVAHILTNRAEVSQKQDRAMSADKFSTGSYITNHLQLYKKVISGKYKSYNKAGEKSPAVV